MLEIGLKKKTICSLGRKEVAAAQGMHFLIQRQQQMGEFSALFLAALL